MSVCQGLDRNSGNFAIKCQISAMKDNKAIRRTAFPRATTAKRRVFMKEFWNRKKGRRLGNKRQRCFSQRAVIPHSNRLSFQQSVGICYSQSTAPAHCIKQNCSGHHRLIKHPQHSLADVRGAEPPQKIEAALSLLVEDFSVLGLVQSVVDEHP